VKVIFTIWYGSVKIWSFYQLLSTKFVSNITPVETNLYIHLHCTVAIAKHKHTQPFYSALDFVEDNQGEPVPEETFTHSHLSWSSIIPYLLPLSTMIHGIPPVQFTCLTVFFTISFWSTTWPDTLHFILHMFLHPIIAFYLQHMPIPSQAVL